MNKKNIALGIGVAVLIILIATAAIYFSLNHHDGKTVQLTKYTNVTSQEIVTLTPDDFAQFPELKELFAAKNETSGSLFLSSAYLKTQERYAEFSEKYMHPKVVFYEGEYFGIISPHSNG